MPVLRCKHSQAQGLCLAWLCLVCAGLMLLTSLKLDTTVMLHVISSWQVAAPAASYVTCFRYGDVYKGFLESLKLICASS